MRHDRSCVVIRSALAVAALFALPGGASAQSAAGAQSTRDAGQPLMTLSAPSFQPTSSDSDERLPDSFAVEAPRVVQLGWGWDQQRGAPIPTTCIDYEPEQRLAQTSNISIQEVSDNYTLSKAMNVSSSVSVRAMGAKVDGKAQLAKTAKVSSMSVSYLVTAEVLNSARFVAPKAASGRVQRTTAAGEDADAANPGEAGNDGGEPGTVEAVKLAPWAAQLANTEIEDFRRVCGDGYVRATIDGARAYLLSVVETTTKSQRETMRASVSGSGWGQKVEAAAGTDDESETSNMKRNLTFFQEGGSAKAAGEDTTRSDLPRNAEQAIERIARLASAAADAGKPFEIEIGPYEVLHNFPHHQRLFSQREEHDELTALWGSYTTIYDDLAAVLDEPEKYLAPRKACGADGGCTVEFLPVDANPDLLAMIETMQDETLTALARIESGAEECLNEDECDVDAAGTEVRSPYAVLANMPMPQGSSPSLRDHTSIFLRDMASGRCHLGAQTPGCISNAEINAWAWRTGMVNRAVTDRNGMNEAILECNITDGFRRVYGDADDEGTEVLWHTSNLKFDQDGDLICPQPPPPPAPSE